VNHPLGHPEVREIREREYCDGLGP
jgi:hypothetical protein